MKNLDIENLERKNIFKKPESFFENMQAKILQEFSSGKYFDVENLERKNIFKIPQDFFENMQEKVLQEIQPVQAKKEGRSVKMNWVYAAAAAITMFFGITFFVNQNKADENMYVAESKTSNTENSIVTDSFTNINPQIKETVGLKNSEKNLTSVSPEHQKVSTKAMTTAAKSKTSFADQKAAPKQNTEVRVEQLLSNFTSAEVAQMGKNTEQDIYLDLYN